MPEGLETWRWFSPWLDVFSLTEFAPLEKVGSPLLKKLMLDERNFLDNQFISPLVVDVCKPEPLHKDVCPNTLGLPDEVQGSSILRAVAHEGAELGVANLIGYKQQQLLVKLKVFGKLVHQLVDTVQKLDENR
jgi:hypothetical protein